MVRVEGTCKFNYEVDLDINSFDDIDEDHMSIMQSDTIIQNAIADKYGIDAYSIFVQYPIKG